MKNTAEKHYSITSVCKEDMRELYNSLNKKMLAKIDKLTDADMKAIAEKLADDYCEQLFWDSLKIILKDYRLSGD